MVILLLQYNQYILCFNLGREYIYNFNSTINVYPSSKSNLKITNPTYNLSAKLKLEVLDESQKKFLIKLIVLFLKILF